MVRELFPVEEWKKSNVKGVLGKEQLNPEKLTLVKEAMFQMYPSDVGEREDYAWRMCCKAIDESCHWFNKEREKLRKKENIPPQWIWSTILQIGYFNTINYYPYYSLK